MEKANEGVYEHDVYVRSFQTGEVRGELELAELVIVNSVNQEEYTFSVYSSEDELEVEQVREDGLNTVIWLSGIDEDLSLDVDQEQLEIGLDNALYQSSLNDFLKNTALQDVTEKILDYHINGQEFLYKVPFEQLNIDMRTVLIDEEITRMTKAAHADELVKEDVINFGTLIGKETDISVGQLNYLKEPMEKALSDGILTPYEKQAVQFTFDAIQLGEPQLERNKEQEKSNKAVTREVEFEMGR